MVDTSTDTNLKQPVFNEMTKTIFDRQTNLSDNEFYFVDPQYTGDKVVVTNGDGDMIEATMGNGVTVDNGVLNTNDYYGTCSTAASTQVKVVTCPNFILREGATITVKFTYAQTFNASSSNYLKLNVNNTGEINVMRVGTTAAPRYWWNAGALMTFLYDGTNFVSIDGTISTTSYYGVVQLANSGGSTSTSTALVPAALNNACLYMINGAPIYSTSGTYAVGDYCRYTASSITKMYRCKTAITTGHAWNAAEWDELPDLFTMITTGDILKNISGYDGTKVQTLKHDASGNVQWVDD